MYEVILNSKTTIDKWTNAFKYYENFMAVATLKNVITSPKCQKVAHDWFILREWKRHMI